MFSLPLFPSSRGAKLVFPALMAGALTGCGAVGGGVGFGVGIAPGIGLNLGLGTGGPSVGISAGRGPLGVGVGVDGGGRVLGSAGVGASSGPVGVGLGSSSVLYDPHAHPAPPTVTGAQPGVVVPGPSRRQEGEMP